MKRLLSVCWLAMAFGAAGAVALRAQGVTTSTINVTVTDSGGAPIPGARITAVHLPSGTTYTSTTRSDGRAAIPGMRVGGPYRVSSAAIGFTPAAQDNIYLTLGVAADLTLITTRAAVTLTEITVAAQKDAIFSSERTGAATAVPKEVFTVLPTISRGLENFTRLSPQASGTSFAGQDNRLNNITVDGTYFNNSFGLGSAPGARTGVAPISIDAIEQVQVNLAPFDVRQGNFTGAGVNTVTKSGTNTVSGSLQYLGRDQSMVGTQAGANTFNPGTFKFHQFGATLGGPIIRNRLFFFASYENDGNTQPATSFLANTGGQTVGGNTTRVLASDLDSLSSFLKNSFNYVTGPYQAYNFNVPSTRFLGKLDYNLNDHNKVSVRYNLLNSTSDQIESNSNSLGVSGNRNLRTDAMSFQSSNYKIKENNRALAAELTSTFGGNKANDLTLGYFKSDESRDSLTATFPLVDIQNAGTTYTSFGFEPFTPGNQLRYKSYQFQDNFTIYGRKHDINIGVTAEKYHSDNVFFPGSQSVYVYNSLSDFYTDANDFIANPTRTVSPVTLRRFQVRYNNVPGQKEPLQPLQVLTTGAYVQDNWRVGQNFRLTVGVRADIHSFDSTALENTAANALTFRDQNGNPVQYKTQKLPDATPLWSPRLGFNWDASGGKHNLQVRGGTGVFSGSPPFVWISNQVGQNGILTGFLQADNTKAFPFNPNPDAYKPATVTGAPAASYELDFTDPKFKFTQIWRTDLAVDKRLPWGLVGTAEYIYNKDVNGVSYMNANLPAPATTLTGPDTRPRYPTGTNANRINPNITAAYVMFNENTGSSWIGALSLEKEFRNGLFAKAAYSYGEAKNTFDPGSIAGGTWTSNAQSKDPNNPGVGFSNNSPGKRVFLAASYRREYFKFGATTVSVFWQSQTIGNTSYTVSGDLNNDGASNNDLMYIPKDQSEMNFQQYTATVSGVVDTFTVAAQNAAFDAFINQDKYLSARRGQYAARNAVFLPMSARADLSVIQEVFGGLRGTRNALQFRLDIINVGNLINKNWGVGQRMTTTQPIVFQSVDANNKPIYRLRNIGNDLVGTGASATTFQPTASSGDVFRIQLGARYTIN